MKKHGEQNVKHKPVPLSVKTWRIWKRAPLSLLQTVWFHVNLYFNSVDVDRKGKETWRMQVFLGNRQQPQQSRSAACAMIPNQQSFTKQDERFNFTTIFSGCQIGQVHVIFRSDQAQWHSSWSSFLTESKIFWTFRLFSPNFRHSSRRFRRIQS